MRRVSLDREENIREKKLENIYKKNWSPLPTLNGNACHKDNKSISLLLLAISSIPLGGNTKLNIIASQMLHMAKTDRRKISP